CLGCVQKDVKDSLFLLDSNAFDQRAVVLSLNKKLRRSGDAATKRKAKRAAKVARRLYQENWAFTWLLPQASVSSTIEIFCAQQDNSELIEGFQRNSETFVALVQELVDELIASSGKKRAGRGKLKRATSLHGGNLSVLSQIPRVQSTCS